MSTAGKLAMLRMSNNIVFQDIALEIITTILPLGFNNNQSQGRGNNVNGDTLQNRQGGGRFNRHRDNNCKPTCALCGKFSHGVVVCYPRFEEEFNNPIRGNNIQVNNNTTAFIATPEIVTYPNWSEDSGATNHVTNDFGNLQFKTKYYDTGSLTVGDGTKLTIAHVGNINVSLDQMPLKLKSVLHVPHVQQNLLGVAKLN